MARKEVAILGVGLHKFGRFPEKKVEELGREAGLMALKDAGVDYRDIQIGFCAHVQQAVGTGLRTFGELGMTGIPVTNVEVACASASRGVVLAAELIAAGVYDLALVIGVEKMQRGMIDASRGAERTYEDLLGLMPMPGVYAYKAQRHMHLYGTKREHFAQVSVISHNNGALNPYAQYQTPIALEEVLNSRMIADPITLYQCSPTTDGASAVVVCSKEKARQYATKPVLLVGWAMGTPQYIPGDPSTSNQLLSEGNTPELARRAYEAAGVGPSDIGVVQVHDAFSPGVIFNAEDLGFCPKGEGGTFVWEGNTEINGKIPINTDGGLESRGHPIGATGGAMIAELYWQVKGQAGPRQVKDARVALLQNVGLGGENVMVFTM